MLDGRIGCVSDLYQKGEELRGQNKYVLTWAAFSDKKHKKLLSKIE